MRILKIVLSVVALLLGAATGVNMIGDYVVTPDVAQLLLAGAGVLAMLGVQPVAVPLPTARLLSALSVVIAGLVAAHVGGKVPGPDWLFKTMGGVGIFLGLAGRSPIQPPAPKT